MPVSILWYILTNKSISCLVHFLFFIIFLYKGWLPQIKLIHIQFSSVFTYFPPIPIRNHQVRSEWHQSYKSWHYRIGCTTLKFHGVTKVQGWRSNALSLSLGKMQTTPLKFESIWICILKFQNLDFTAWSYILFALATSLFYLPYLFNLS